MDEKVTITGKDVGEMLMEGMDLSDFFKLAKLNPQPKCDSDLITCPVCKMSMGIKKWSRLATKDAFVCPHFSCRVEIKPKTKLEVVLRKIVKYEVESVESNTASVEIRPDGTKLIKEVVNIKVKPVTHKK